MKWHYKTDTDFKWPKQNEKVLLADFNGAAWVSYFNEVGIDTVEAWAKIEPPKKKRWKPVQSERYWSFGSGGGVVQHRWEEDAIGTIMRNTFGVYKTEREAEIMRDKIKDFVTKEIGEV